MKTSYGKVARIMALVIGVLGVSFAHAQPVTGTSGEVKWIDAPGSLSRGAKLAMLYGDFGRPVAFTFQLKLPAGYQIKPHMSSGIDLMFVQSGTFNMGYGNEFDKAATLPMGAGYVAGIPPKTTYFAWTDVETILYVQGIGPWTVTYVNPDDDPRKKK